MEIPSFNALIQKSIVDHWDMDALTDYKGATLQYHDVARKIEKLHIMFENSGVVKGDKIALCGRNSANWAVAFLATPFRFFFFLRNSLSNAASCASLEEPFPAISPRPLPYSSNKPES